MRRSYGPALAALPGCVVMACAFAGWSPALSDLDAYFVPLRARTAEVLAARRGPFWNPDVGCGEPFYANPQTCLLYPPGWMATIVPARTAVGIEVGLHIAILGVGCALLARRLGAQTWTEVAAAWGVAMCGPVADSAGVLNNLESLAWAPWVWWAALGGSWRWVTVFLALAYLGAEPQLALIIGLIAVALAPTRRTVGAIAIAACLVAVQAVPFLAWVRGGDRGRAGAELMTTGAVTVDELPAVALPDAPLRPRADRYVPHPVLPLWAFVFGVLALLGRDRATRRLAACGSALLVAAVIAGLPWGARAWAVITFGLVRYPARLLFIAAVAFIPAAAAAAQRQERRRIAQGAALALVAVAAGAHVGANVPLTIGQALAAGGALAFPGVGPIAAAGALALAPVSVAALEFEHSVTRQGAPCLAAQRGGGRVYAVAPSRDQLAWMSGDPVVRSRALGYGYLALEDGRRMVRTFAPLASGSFSAHLGHADEGAAGRWWLDSLGAARIVTQHAISGFPEVCRAGDFVVLENPRAWLDGVVLAVVPAPGELPRRHGEATTEVCDDDFLSWRVSVEAGGGVLIRLSTPDHGWRYRVDGKAAEPVAGAGIIHGITVGAGSHLVTARYRPPGLWLGAFLSVLSLVVLMGSPWRRS